MVVVRSLAFVLAFSLGVAHAERHEDPTHGYSIEIPEGWYPFSPEEMDRMQQLLRNVGDRSDYIAGFKAAQGPLQMPYMLVQWFPNSLYEVKVQLTEDDMQRMVEAMEESNAQRAVESSTPEFTPDLPNRRALYAYKVDLHGMSVCCLGLMQFGRYGVLQSLYYATTMEEIAEGTPARNTITSLQLTPEAMWNEAAFAEASESEQTNRTDRLVRGILLGVAVAGLLGMALSALTKKRK